MIITNLVGTDHVCNEDLFLLILDDGLRVEETPENYEKYQKQIIGGSVACSICGRAAIDNALRMSYEFEEIPKSNSNE